MAQEVQRDQITEQIVWQRHIEGMVAAQGCVAQATGCQLEASTRLLGRPGLRIFDVRFVLVPLTAMLDATPLIQSARCAPRLWHRLSSCHIANNNNTKYHHRRF